MKKENGFIKFLLILITIVLAGIVILFGYVMYNEFAGNGDFSFDNLELIYPKIEEMIEKGSYQFKAMENAEHMIIISIVVTLIAVLLLKGIFYKKNTSYLFGGSVSGHAALAFNLSTIATILADNISLIIIVNILAIIVAESRYEAKIHSLKEVVLGSILGISLALLLFMKFI